MKKILFDISGHETWIGGIYYMRNVLFQICIKEEIRLNFRPIIVYSTKFEKLFDCFDSKAIIYKYSENSRIQRAFSLLKATSEADYIYYYHDFKFDPFHILEKKAIYWIPDFQECYYPEFFTLEQLQFRKMRAERYINGSGPIVFSSKSCEADFFKFYCKSKERKNLYTIPFVSAIEDEVMEIAGGDRVSEIYRQKLGFKYALVSNQFWQHKNHLVVLEAMEIMFRNNKELDFKIAFTGKLDDFRNQEFVSKISFLFQKPEIKEHAVMLGFIDRTEQLAIMKEASFIIQPSLFEGWGTVVEDAKVLDKTILLSDIPVHREQMNDKCILFDPEDPEKLAKLIEEEICKEHHDDIEKGIADMHARAKEYSKGFERLLRDVEENIK